MARIAGINIPPNQHAEIGLTAIYGIGRPRARQILESVGVETSKKVKDLTDAELEKIRDAIGQFTVEGDLRREVQLSIKRLIELTEECVIVVVYLFADREHAPMLVPVKVRRKLV